MPSRPIFDDWGWRMKKLWGAPWWCAHQGGGFPTLEPQTVRDGGTTQLPHSNPCVWNLLNFTIKSLWMAACTFAKIFPNSCQKLFISHCIDHRLSPLPTLCMAGVKSIKTQDGKLTKKRNARRLIRNQNFAMCPSSSGRWWASPENWFWCLVALVRSLPLGSGQRNLTLPVNDLLTNKTQRVEIKKHVPLNETFTLWSTFAKDDVLPNNACLYIFSVHCPFNLVAVNRHWGRERVNVFFLHPIDKLIHAPFCQTVWKYFWLRPVESLESGQWFLVRVATSLETHATPAFRMYLQLAAVKMLILPHPPLSCNKILTGCPVKAPDPSKAWMSSKSLRSGPRWRSPQKSPKPSLDPKWTLFF